MEERVQSFPRMQTQVLVFVWEYVCVFGCVLCMLTGGCFSKCCIKCTLSGINWIMQHSSCQPWSGPLFQWPGPAFFACELTWFICVVPANGCHLFQIFDINMQRAEACTHKTSFLIVVLQPKGTTVRGWGWGREGGSNPLKSQGARAEPTACLSSLLTSDVVKKNNHRHKEEVRKEGKGLWGWVRDVQCPAKYVHLFSMPLMGHISLGALCLLPNCKRYLSSHLQEIPCFNDSSRKRRRCLERVKLESYIWLVSLKRKWH